MFSQIELFGQIIKLYIIMMLFGVLAFGIYAGVTAVKHKYYFLDMAMFFFILSIGVIIGSHLFYALVNYKNMISVIENNKQINIFSALGNIFGGRMFYGGLVGALAAGFIVIKIDNNYIKYFDIIAAGIPLFHFFAKIGCFLGGCCYEIQSKIGFNYYDSSSTDIVTRFPAQLLESIFCIVLFLFLNYLFINDKFKNNLLYLYLLIYSTGRFFIEYLRGDTYRGIWFYLSISQIISVLIIIFILIKILILYKNSIYLKGEKKK